MDRRIFLTAGASAALLARGASAWAETLLEGEAVRLSDNALKLDWNAERHPISIYVSSDPDALPDFMREVKAAARGGNVQLLFAVAPRPYFLLSAKGTGQTRVAERLLPLQGGRNFRDLGGYRATDGRQVRWGRLYRSGVMAGLTPADIRYLAGLNLKVVCDLRSSQERVNEPSPFLAADAPEVIAVDYDLSSSMGKLFQARTRAEAIDVFAAAYVDFIDVLAAQYKDMFTRLVRREFPLAMNCSAGKDRTGVGSALVLSVLGVPRDTVVADYALTQVYTPPAYYKKLMAQGGGKLGGVSEQQAQAFARMPPEVLDVMMGSDPQVMRLALEHVDAKFGSPVELAKNRFDLTDEKIAYLRDVYLI